MALAASMRWSDGVNAVVKRLQDALLSQTSLTRPPSPYVSFGALSGSTYRRDDTLASAAKSALEALSFTVSGARERLKELVSAASLPASLSGLMDALSQKLIRLETRIYGTAAPVNYLFDEITRKAVPAAQVDRRLSHGGVIKAYGRTVNVEALARAQRLRTDPEFAAAEKIRKDLLPYQRATGSEVPFSDWQEFRFMAQNVFGGREYTVQGKTAYIGKPCFYATEDQAENLRLIREQYAKGNSLIVPADTLKDALEGKLVIGMPVIFKRGALLAERVDPKLGHEYLTQLYGVSLFDRMRELQAGSPAAQMPGLASANVVSFAEFKMRFGQQEKPKSKAPAPTPAPEAIVLRPDFDRDGNETVVAYDEEAQEPINISAFALMPGIYAKQDGFGLPDGYAEVTADRTIRFLDDNHRLHSLSGSAVIGEPGRGTRPVYAIWGEELPESDYAVRRTEAMNGPDQDPPAPAPAVRL